MFELKDYVDLNDRQYLVSTINTFDKGLETMVFESADKEVIDWRELYCRRYDSVENAHKGHREVIDNLELCINIYKAEDIDVKYFDILNKMLEIFGIEEEI